LGSNPTSQTLGKLRRRIDQLNELNACEVEYNDQTVENIEHQIIDTILDVFGASSSQFHTHQYYEIWEGSHILDEGDSTKQRKFEAGIPKAITMLEGLIRQLEEKRLDLDIGQPVPNLTPEVNNNQRVFIVHGRDESFREKVARFVQRIGLDPIILHEQPNSGQTIIEKFERNSDVGYAVVLLTTDDLACL